jgi:hypothetical protein
LNIAMQRSDDPLQDLVRKPRIVDGTSQRDRTDQRRQEERGIVRIAGWRQAGEQVEVAADLGGICRPGSLAAAGDVRGKRRDRAPGFGLVAVKRAQVRIDGRREVRGPASSALARRLAAEIIRPAAVSSDRDPKLPPLGCEGCELEIIAALASSAMQRRSVAAGC